MKHSISGYFCLLLFLRVRQLYNFSFSKLVSALFLLVALHFILPTRGDKKVIMFTVSKTVSSYRELQHTDVGRNVVFGHIARLSEDTPAHQALRCHVDLSLGHLPDQGWRRRPPKQPMDWPGPQGQQQQYHQLICGGDPSCEVIRGWRFGLCRLRVNDDDGVGLLRFLWLRMEAPQRMQIGYVEGVSPSLTMSLPIFFFKFWVSKCMLTGHYGRHAIDENVK